MADGKLGILGGTFEGRVMAEFCQKRKIPAVISVATWYGSQCLREDENLAVHIGRMDHHEMKQWLKKNKVQDVIDATHPFARAVSENMKRACQDTGISYHRLVRTGEAGEWRKAKEDGSDLDQVILVSSVREAALLLKWELLAHPEGNVLITTGRRELVHFSEAGLAKERLYARVLPSAEGIQACLDAGLKGSHILAMQGPFSYEMNCAMLKSVRASWLVTKEAGQVGGFREKLEAAQDLGCRIIVVGRPEREQGKSLEEMKKWVEEMYGEGQLSVSAHASELSLVCQVRELSLIGIGMGNPELMTVEAIQALLDSDGILGASRMVECGRVVLQQFEKEKRERAFFTAYRPEELLSWLDTHQKIQRPVILYSGDAGFYSGGEKMVEMIQKGQYPYRCRMISGISSLAYFASKLGKSWGQVRVISLHGREWQEEDGTLAGGGKQELFFLLDGSNKLRKVCRKLLDQGQEKAEIWVGERLSYEDERIFSGTPRELLGKEIHDLAVAWAVLR